MKFWNSRKSKAERERSQFITATVQGVWPGPPERQAAPREKSPPAAASRGRRQSELSALYELCRRRRVRFRRWKRVWKGWLTPARRGEWGRSEADLCKTETEFAARGGAVRPGMRSRDQASNPASPRRVAPAPRARAPAQACTRGQSPSRRPLQDSPGFRAL